MSVTEECHRKTKDLYDLVKGASFDDPVRDEVMERLDQLLDERQLLLDQFKPPFSDDEKKLGMEILEWDRVIESKLTSFQQAIQRDINGLSKKKSSINKYVNPYESMQHDGMFYDKKK
jgi:flagellar protein FliT